MKQHLFQPPKSQTENIPRTLPDKKLRRKCACDQHIVAGGECAECRKKHEADVLQHAALGPNVAGEVPPIVYDVLRSPGQPLDAGTRAFMEPRFGHDFSGVRVHTDAKAAESARAVNALAYTVGREMVFGAGQYVPTTNAGRKLMAHELTHVVQQSSVAPIFPSLLVQSANSMYETEAEANLQLLENTQPTAIYAKTAEPIIMRKQGSSGAQATLTTAQVIERARIGAFVRCQQAYERLVGLGPMQPRVSETGRVIADPAREWQMRARALVLRIFGEDLNMNQVAEIVGRMRNYLTPGFAVVRSPISDPECSGRNGYVRGLRPPVFLCSTFFSSSQEQQTRTLIHEAAHLAGIGSASLGEAYCPIYDCETSCGGFDTADSWAHFVNCLSGQPADQPEVIQVERNMPVSTHKYKG